MVLPASRNSYTNILNVCRTETREGLAEGKGSFIYGGKASAAGITGRAYQGLS